MLEPFAGLKSRARESAILAIVSILLFFYIFWFRTHGISETFWLYADQVRDWQVALRSFGDLPLVGPPSLAGGNTAGPPFYWFLWLVDNTIGRWLDHLPHAGGIGIALLQSAADAVLFFGLARRLDSVGLALAIVLMVATAGPDAAVTATIWNPPVANALVKIALAVTMIAGVDSVAILVTVTALAWLAVQAHTTPLPVTLTLLAYAAASGGTGEKRLPAFGKRVAIMGAVMATLQIPWLVHQLTVDAVSQPSPMAQSIVAVLTDPLNAPRPLESGRALLRAAHFNTGLPLPPALFTALLIAGAAVLVARMKDALIRAIAVGPLVCAAGLFAVWQGPLNENYWYLSLGPSVALSVLGWIAATPRIVRTALAVAALALILLAQPMQAKFAWSSLRTPVYGALVRGARATLTSGRSIREIATTFPMPAGTDPAYVYSLLGGTLDAAASERVVISESGAVRFEKIQ